MRQMADPHGEVWEQQPAIQEADLLGVKPTADILVHGDAIGPKGKARHRASM